MGTGVVKSGESDLPQNRICAMMEKISEKRGTLMRGFQQELTEDFYSREVEVPFPGCTSDQTAKLSTLLGYAVSIAGVDYDARGFPYETLVNLRQVFLLSRLSLRVHRQPTLGDVLNIVTWEEGVRGVQVQRNCVMEDRAGETLVSARSQWILVDPESHKILRPGTFTARTIGERGVAVDCPPCGKLALPPEAALLGNRKVVWSDLDGNAHVYSGNYGDIFWDYLPPALQGKHVRDFAINYHKEAVLGEELALSGYQTEDGFLLAGTGDREVCFTAACRFAD